MTKPSARAAPLKKATIERGRLAAAQANLAEISNGSKATSMPSQRHIDHCKSRGGPCRSTIS
jgi:hypothetical protein